MRERGEAAKHFGRVYLVCVFLSLSVLIHRVVCIPCREQINVLLNSMPLV